MKIKMSSSRTAADANRSVGSLTDRPQAADYDGDRKSDYAIYRDGEWWILRSRDGQTRTYRFGANFHIAMSDGGIQHAFITN